MTQSTDKPKTTMQRIRLRIEGSPVKLDGTIISINPTGKEIIVQFDGPLPNRDALRIQLYADAFRYW